MKKFMSIFVVILMSVAFCFGAAAEGRNAFEFCDLYSARIKAVDEAFSVTAGYSTNDFSFSAAEYMNWMAGEDKYYVNVPAGTLMVSVPDFNVVRYEGTVLNIAADTDKRMTDFYRAAVAYSALEYSGSDEYFQEMLSRVDRTKSGNFVIDAVDEFSQLFIDVVNDTAKADKLYSDNGSMVMLASSDNYDYYLQYFCGETDDGKSFEYIDLLAEAK